jgi:hypothetical protein
MSSTEGDICQKEFKMNARTNWGMPIDWDYEGAVATIRFWLMMKFRRPGEPRWEEIFDYHFKEIEKVVSENIEDTYQKEKLLTSIATRAYNTIPQEFYRNLKVVAEQKPIAPVKVLSKKKKRK